MKREYLSEEEKQKRIQILRDFYQWKESTGKRRPGEYSEMMGVDYALLTRSLKWNRLLKTPAVDPPERKEDNTKQPTLVPVTKHAPVSRSSSIHIILNRSTIDLNGEISAPMLYQILTTLGALDVL